MSRVRVQKECLFKDWIGYIEYSNCNGTFRVKVRAHTPEEAKKLAGAEVFINLLPEEVEPC